MRKRDETKNRIKHLDILEIDKVTKSIYVLKHRQEEIKAKTTNTK